MTADHRDELGRRAERQEHPKPSWPPGQWQLTISQLTHLIETWQAAPVTIITVNPADNLPDIDTPGVRLQRSRFVEQGTALIRQECPTPRPADQPDRWPEATSRPL